MKKKKITGNLLVKIIVFFLMTVFVGVGSLAGFIYVYAENMGIYDDFRGYLESRYYWQARNDQSRIYNLLYEGDYELIDSYCQENWIYVKIYREDGTLLYDNYEPCYDPFIYAYDNFPSVVLRSPTTGNIIIGQEEEGEQVRIVLYVSASQGVGEYGKIYNQAEFLYSNGDLWMFIIGCMIFLVMICFIFLMCSAGHHNEYEELNQDTGAGPGLQSGERSEVKPGVLHGIYLDILLAVFFLAWSGSTFVMVNLAGFHAGLLFPFNGIMVMVWAMLTAVLGTIFSMELAIRIKMGKFWQTTLIYAVIRFFYRAIRMLGNGIIVVFNKLPVLAAAIAGFVIISGLEFIGILICSTASRNLRLLVLAWFIEKILLFAALCYFVLTGNKLMIAGKALAEGDISYQADTRGMISGYKEHGNHLNSIGKGMAIAVQERMKSEHLKTELITNVSHDLKTPLTSIINYSDLLSHVDGDSDKVKEYSEVLHRQSEKLKKLLDDLLEVSKASTGAVAVEYAPCDVKVLVAQTTGEYTQRFAEKKLELITALPQEDIFILADNRHMWRIFDNLLGNIYKYSQPASRVYLNVEKKNDKVQMIFRNISEYPLNIDGEELKERFVRGDSSRHKEGNGLGLSIAVSLAKLQGGDLEIVTDGDLFKAVLEFSMNTMEPKKQGD